MTSLSFELIFIGEFVAMVASVLGVSVVVLRSRVVSGVLAQLLVAAGFVLNAGAAFAYGSLIVGSDSRAELAVVRLAGSALVLAGSLRWAVGRVAMGVLQLGLLVGIAGAVGDLVPVGVPLCEALRIVGFALVAVALNLSLRGSLVARIAGGIAGALLLMVVVLAVALSTVITHSVQTEELHRLQGRTLLEGSELSQQVSSNVKDARFAVADLEAYLGPRRSNPLVQLASRGGTRTSTAQVASRVEDLSDLYPPVEFAYLGEGGAVVAGRRGSHFDFAKGVSAAGGCGSTGRSPVGGGAIVLQGRTLWALGTFPACSPVTGRKLGTAVAVRPLDTSYLSARRAIDKSVSLCLVASSGVVARTGSLPPAAMLRSIERRIPDLRGATSRVAGGRFVSIQAVLGPSRRPVAALVLTSSQAVLGSARLQLFKTLFLIALGGTILALALAVLAGDRITSGLRRLTEAVRAVQRGHPAELAGIGARDEVGVLGAAFGSMIDSVEQRNRDLRAAATDEARLRDRIEAVLAGMADPLLAIDAAGIVTDYNGAAVKLFSLPPGGAVGRHLAEVLELTDDDGSDVLQELVRPHYESVTVMANLRLEHGGPVVPVGVSAGTLHSPGPDRSGADVTGTVPSGTVLVFRDLRREREVERMKTEFLSRVGHELRTPLTGILGFADILANRKVSPSQAETWNREILSSAKKLMRLVERLELVALSGAGRARMRSEPVDVGGLLRRLTSSWSDRMPLNLSMHLDVVEAVPDVLGDERWLYAALDELVDNAVKFSPAGGVIALGTAVVVAEGAPALSISVSDTGMGMSPTEARRAFGAFVQGDESDTRGFGGLGAGLAFVEAVVSGLGGVVELESEPGSGSRFEIRMPLGRVVEKG